MSKMRDLITHGQAVWLDFIRREYLQAGKLSALVAEGLRGVTSNPSIFEKAIAGSNDYDEEMKSLIESGKTIDEIYETLAIADIQTAADQLKEVYDETNCRDGFVSLEVSPTLAYDTDGTIKQAKRLYQAVNRPNLMIKVPATPEGIPAIAELIGSGINVNVTLIFSLVSYRDVMNAYLDGLEKLAKDGPSVPGGHDVSRIASVASFFVSRVDAAVDKQLIEKGRKDLIGKTAIANAKAAYDEFEKTFSGARWEKLAAADAAVQRPLWASTSTKNPDFPDVLYVETLIGAHTVNTIPPATLDAFLDHGIVEATLTDNIDEAVEHLNTVEALGISITAVTDKLLSDGVDSFAKSFESLMNGIRQKRDALLAGKLSAITHLNDAAGVVAAGVEKLAADNVMARIWEHDHTVWKDEPDEITNRLGWLHSPAVMRDAIDEINTLVAEVREAGYTKALLLGMGGSSLAPEVFSEIFGTNSGYLDVSVLDSTDPGAVLSRDEAHDPAKTLYIVSTKSGGTVETLSFAKYFYNRAIEAVGRENAGAHFVAITDPGSKLESLAASLNFRKTFLNDPNIGGRYSALSYFGSVPAALLGMDLTRLYDNAAVLAADSLQSNGVSARLGVIMGEMALAGRDKLTLITSPKLRPFGAWVEQLVAESTGKEGKGVLPVDLEALLDSDAYADDRVFVYLRLAGENKYDAAFEALTAAGHPTVRFDLDSIYELGGEFFRWEIATVIASRILDINPFDQPNVESAKVVAREMVAAYHSSGVLPALTPNLEAEGMTVYGEGNFNSLSEVLENFLGNAASGNGNGASRSYIALQAYVNPESGIDAALQKLRTTIQQKHKLATTLGYGPRFLHSTGQLHKGDGGNGLFLQLTADMPADAAIPDTAGESASAMSFAVLRDAQALGDRQALLDNQRKVLRIHLGADAIAALKHLSGLL